MIKKPNINAKVATTYALKNDFGHIPIGGLAIPRGTVGLIIGYDSWYKLVTVDFGKFYGVHVFHVLSANVTDSY